VSRDLQLLPPGARFDLHLHSTASDGELEPEEVLRRCARAGLQAIALTDHDLPPALPWGRQVVAQRMIRVIHGVELSGAWRGVELHLLVYFPGEMPDCFKDFCRERARRRAARYEAAVARLALPGLPPADGAARRGERSLTRLHLSRSLVDAGHVPDLSTAFARYTGHKHGLVPLIDLSLVEALRQARAAGGVCSWAHPRLEQVLAWLPELVAAGLQGLEGLRPGSDASTRNTFRRMARDHGLFLTGGSDYHGFGSARLGNFGVSRRDLGGFLAALDAAA